MRALTEAEARVISVLLAAAPETERERLRTCGLARSTYHDVRRRVYAEGWVRDRYLPHPAFFGLTRATFVLGRPFVDRIDRLVGHWQSQPNAPVVWTGPQLAFGVFLHADERAAAAARARLTDSEMLKHSFVLDADLTQSTVPVFLDFEGGWSHMTGLQGSGGYPRGLGGASAPGVRLPARWNWAMEEVLRRPEVAPTQGIAPHLVGPDRLPRSQRQLVELGWASYRVMPDFVHLPVYQGRQSDEVVFITGERVESAEPERLFSILTEECRVFPFLLARDDRKFLIGTMAQSSSSNGVAPPTDTYRKPVFPTLQDHLRNIEVIPEEISSLRIWNDLVGSVFLRGKASTGRPDPA
ncbi:MAG TPA: hypothetical protein VJS68_01115, partial [Thermoplasmata archaeon]|nr:hypothetical protein [Thermoplasmata archaeon]